MGYLQHAIAMRKTLFIMLVPVITLPIALLEGTKEMLALYGVVIIASFWITEVLPMAVTSLLPVVIFPLLGVIPVKAVAVSYIKDALIFSFSCLSFAVCVVKWNLHRRVALYTLMMVGSSPKWLTLGFMLPTWFLSMWVNNTSATSMMLPMVTAVLTQLKDIDHQKRVQARERQQEELSDEKYLEKSNDQKDDSKMQSVAPHSPDEDDDNSAFFRHMCKALSLCVCYAATIGGTGSVTGTTTNMVVKGQADEFFESYGLDSGINFLAWMMSCFPLSVCCFLVAWIWLVFHFFGLKELLTLHCGDKASTDATRQVVKSHLHALGPFTFAEKAVVGHFIVLVSLWLTMKMPGGFGWSYYFQPGYVNNSTPGILILVSLCIFPSEWPSVFFADEKDVKPTRSLLTWQDIQEEFPWSCWLLLGGGYSIGNVCKSSGLSLWLGEKMRVFASMPPWLMLILLSLSVSFLTEITSNSATASILGPIVSELAIALQMNPLFLLLPVALSCSMAFMLPMATGPNAVVFATGYIEVKDMVKAGVVLNFLCVMVINIAVNSWMIPLFNLDHLPPEMRWKAANTTEAFVFSNLTTPSSLQ